MAQHEGIAARGDGFSMAAADYFVPSLPGLPNLASHPTHPLNVYAGTLPSYPGPPAGTDGKDATGKDAQIFFMMIKARRAAGKERVIFWFNGGPGCSSFDGALMEVGPFRTVNLGESGEVELRLVESGWEEYATVIFVDQPPGTGLSTVPTNGYLHELSEASAHLIHFMQNFYAVFPELRQVDTYLAGESFAGQYIPYFADAILSAPAFNAFPLRGIAIGNGWIDPREQYQGYVDFGYAKGLIREGSKEAEAVEAQMQRCRVDTDQWEDGSDMPINMNACGGVMDSVTKPFNQDLNGKTVCMNVYDTRLVDDWPACGMDWPPDLPDVYVYLRRPEVIRALHATAKETAWVECDNSVASELHLQKTPAAVNLIPGILERGVEVMLFAGDEDLICNYVGIERTIERLKWSGGQGLMNATTAKWYVNGTYAGSWRTGRNMTYVRVAGASHMVGYDVPVASSDMMLRFMGVDMAAVAGDSAMMPSRLGDKDRVQLGYVGDSAVPAGPSGPAKSHNWEAWFNAGSSLILMLLIALAAVFYIYLRSKRRDRLARIALDSNSRPRDEEERVPLGAESFELDAPSNGYHDNGNGGASKGKQRSRHDDYDEAEGDGQVVFELGDDDEDRRKSQ